MLFEFLFMLCHNPLVENARTFVKITSHFCMGGGSSCGVCGKWIDTSRFALVINPLSRLSSKQWYTEQQITARTNPFLNLNTVPYIANGTESNFLFLLCFYLQ